MIDPISLIAIAIFGGSLASSAGKMVARHDARSAYGRMQDAFNSAKAQYGDTTRALNALAAERQASLAWVYPLIERTVRRHGLKRQFYDRGSGVFGGRTLRQMRALLVKLREAIVPPANVFDTTIVLTSGGAALIEGVQYLDGIGVVDLPIFHESLSEALAGVTGTSVDHFSSVLGGIGDFGVADLVGDALGLFSAFKLGYNIFRIGELNEIRGDYERRAERADRAWNALYQLENRANDVRQAVRDQGYEAYKWSVIADAAHSVSPVRRHPAFQQIRERLHGAVTGWWSALELSGSRA